MNPFPHRLALAIAGFGIVVFLVAMWLLNGCGCETDMPSEPGWVETVHDAGLDAW